MIFRTNKDRTNPYYLKNRRCAEDSRLSFKAKGILDYLLSKPDHWEAHIEDIVKAGPDGKASVRAGVDELIKYGYIARVQVRKGGKIAGWRLDTFETPELNPWWADGTPILGTDNQDIENQHLDKQDTDFQDVENQDVENRTNSNYSTEVSNEDKEVISDWISRPEPTEAERLFEQIIGRTVVHFESEDLRQLSQQHPASHFKAAFEVIAQRIKSGQNIKYPVEYAKPILHQALSMGLAAFEQPVQPSSPAVAAFVEYWGKQPNDEQARLITDAVDDVGKWKEAMAGWKARNYRWDNVPGQLDYYSRGANQSAGKDKPNAKSGKKVPAEGWHAGLIKPYKPQRQYSEAEIDEWLDSLDNQPPVPAVRPLRKRPGAAAVD